MTNNLSCSDLTKRKIANALKELMAETSFEKITVSDITNKCSIHRQTFYYHFQDRYALLDWLLYTELLEPLVNNFTLENMYEKLYNVFSTMSRSKDFYQSALKINSGDLSRYIGRVASEQFTILINNVRLEKGIKSSEADTLLLAEFFGYGTSGVVLNWAQRGMKESPAKMTQRLESLTNTIKNLIKND